MLRQTEISNIDGLISDETEYYKPASKMKSQNNKQLMDIKH